MRIIDIIDIIDIMIIITCLVYLSIFGPSRRGVARGGSEISVIAIADADTVYPLCPVGHTKKYSPDFRPSMILLKRINLRDLSG
jgi:hypothetical protein